MTARSRRNAYRPIVRDAERLEPRALLAVTVPPDIISDVVEIDDNVLVAAGAAKIEATAGYVQIFGNSRGRIDAVDRAATAGLALEATSAITVTGAIGSVTPFDGLTIKTAATQPVSLQQAVTVDDDLVVTRAGSVTFGGPLTVGDDLTITQAANVLFAGNVNVSGDVTISSAAAVTFSGTLTVGGTLRIVDATGAVRFLGDVTVAGADVNSRDRVIAQAGFGSTGAGGTSGDISFTSDQLGFNAAVISTSAAAATLTIKPWTPSLPIAIASPPGTFTGLLVTDAAINGILGGWKRVVFGDEAAGTGAVTVGSIGSQYGGFSQLLNTTTIVGGSIDVVQPVDVTSQAAYLDLVARSGAITVKSPINQTAAERNDWVRLTAAGPISLEAAVWAAKTLSLTTTDGGAISQKDGVAAALSAPSLSVAADGSVTLADSGNAFETVALQTTDDDVVLRADSGYTIGEVETTDASRPSTKSTTVTGIAAGGGTVRLVTVDAVEAAVSVTQTKPILALGLGLEGADADWTLTHPANAVGTLAASGSTGSVAYRDSDGLTIGTVAAVASRAAIAGIDVSRTVDVSAGGVLTLAAAGDVVAGATGGPAVSLAGVAGIVTSADVTTSGGDVKFNDATRLAGDVTLALAGKGTTGQAVFLSAVDGAQAGQQSLTVTGDLDARASLGASTTLESLSVSGDATLVDGITVRTTGDQTFSGQATSAGTLTVQAGSNATVKFLGDTTLGRLVTRTTDAADYAVTITGAKATIGDAVAFANTGAVTLGDAATDDLWFKAGVTSVVPSATFLAGTIRTTNAAATFGRKTPAVNAITLTADAIVSTGSGAASFAGTVDGLYRLVVNASGDTTFSAAIGSKAPLAHLETDAVGRTLLDGGSVTTASPTSQLYGDAVLLGANTVLTARNGGKVEFAGAIDGGFALAITTSGTTRFGGAVGGKTPLASLKTDAAGSTAIDGGGITTVGNDGQAYGDAVVLGRNTNLLADKAPITFAGTLDGPFSLVANSSGVTTFGKAVGGKAALASLATDSAGTTRLNGGRVTTFGIAGQSYGDAVSLGANTTLNAATGPIAFSSTLDGGYGLTANAGDATIFGGAVGGKTPLTRLTTNAAGTTTIAGGAVTTQGVQTYGDPLTLAAETTLTATTVTTLGTLTGNANALTIVGNAVIGNAAADTVSGLTTFSVTGDVRVNAARIEAATTQTFKAPVTLGTAAVFQAGVVSFEGDVRGGGHDLRVTGIAVLGDAASDSVSGIDDLLITGATVLNASTVTAAGRQTYDGPVTATQATAVALTAAGIGFHQAFDRGEPGIVPTVTITAGAGGVKFGGDAGTQGRPFGATEVRSEGGVSLAGTLWSNGAVTVASTKGSITGGAANAIRSPDSTIQLDAAKGIGQAAKPLGIEAASVSAETSAGGIYLRAVGSPGNLWIGSDGLKAPGAIGLDASNAIGVYAGGRIQAGGGVSSSLPIAWSVATTKDGGPGSLRQILLNINEVGNANAAGLDARVWFEVVSVNRVPAETVFVLATPLPEIRAAVEISSFAGIVLDGDGKVDTGLAFGAAGSGSTLQGLTLRNFTGYGVQLVGAQRVLVEAATVQSLRTASSAGLYARGDLTGTRIIGSTFSGGLRGALLDGARNLVFGALGQGNLVTASRAAPTQPKFSGTGVRAQGDCTGTTIAGNVFTANNYGVGLVNASGLRITGNQFTRNSIAAIYVEGRNLGSSQSGNTFGTGANRNKTNILRFRNGRIG